MKKAGDLETLNGMFKELYSGKVKYFICDKWSVDRWMEEEEITEEDRKTYENAAKAFKLKNTKLYKAIK